jgi:hypothetical protein
MSETPAATRPARARKAVPKKVAEPTEPVDTTTKTYITLDAYPGATVKSYSRWKVSKADEELTGTAGTFYAPLNATEVRVCVVRPS